MHKQTPMNVPFFDISRKIEKHHDGVVRAIEDVIESSSFVLGEFVEKFESLFAQFLGVSSVVSCANGSDALEIALRALDLKSGATVLTAANAGNYVSLAVQTCSFKLAYLDIEPGTWNVGIESIRRSLNSNVDAIVITHLYGTANKQIAEIETFCRQKGIKLIEDCAQAHGAVVDNRRVGSFGDVSTFSFYPTKNLGGLGDGGAISTNNPLIASKAKKLRQYGWNKKYFVETIGGRNSRLDALQASILIYFLPFLEYENGQRRKVAESLYSSLKSTIDFQEFDLANDVFHLLPVCTPKRTALMKHLMAQGVESQIHYPLPDHRQISYTSSKNSKDMSLPFTEELASRVLSLPCNPFMTDWEIEFISSAIVDFFSTNQNKVKIL